MGKEIERAGIAVAQVCTMVNVARSLGIARIVPSPSVLYPTGDPALAQADEALLRQRLVEQALTLISSEVAEGKGRAV